MTVLVISSLMTEAYRNLSADRISYFAYNAERDELQCIISKDIKGMCIPKTAGYVGQSFHTGKVVNARIIQEAHYKYVDEKVGYVTRNVLCAPIFDDNGGKVGVIQAVNKLDNECFTEEDEVSIQEICRILSMYINGEGNKLTKPSWYKSFDYLNEIVDTIDSNVVSSTPVNSNYLPRLEIVRRELVALAKDLRTTEDVALQSNSISGSGNSNSNSNSSGNSNNKSSSSISSRMDVSLPSNLFTWDFNSMDISEVPTMCSVIMKLIQSLPALPEGLNLDVVGSYIQAVSCSYNIVPFHNFQHATCVTHVLYMFIKETNVNRLLNSDTTFGLLLSAIVHDVDHPGHTNVFEINTGSELATIYNDKSVLENHHCSTAFRLMRRSDCAIFNGISSSAARDIRKTVVSAVLSTDMAVHFQMVDEIAKKAPIDGGKLECRNDADRLFLCSVLMHAADLSNPYRRFDMAQQWSKRIAEEFNDQIAKEKELGLPFLPYMATPDEMSLCRNEIGFGSHIVMPFVKNLALLFPELTYIESNLKSNMDKWTVLLEELSNNDANMSASK